MPWALSPAPSATFARLWYPECGQRPLNANCDTLGRESRFCSQTAIEVHQRSSTATKPELCDLSHNGCRRADSGKLRVVAGDRQPRRLGLSHLACMLERMSKSKRRSSPSAKQAQPDRRPAPAEPPGQAQQASPMSPSEVLERIKHTRIAQQEAEAQLAALVD